MLKRGDSGDGCDLASTLRKYDLRKGDLFVELGKGATREAGNYHFSSVVEVCAVFCHCLLLLDA